jgi:hypothetical protein
VRYVAAGELRLNPRVLIAVLGGILIAASSAVVSNVRPARAEVKTWHANVYTDRFDKGGCDLGSGSLRECIDSANRDSAATPGNQEIVTLDPATYTLTRRFDENSQDCIYDEDQPDVGDLDVYARNILIQGAGSGKTIVTTNATHESSETFNGRVFYVNSANAVIQGMKVSKGHPSGSSCSNAPTKKLPQHHTGPKSQTVDDFTESGAGIANDTGSHLRVDDLVVDHNQSMDEAGGIYTDGPLTANHLWVTNNLGAGTGGGLYVDQDATFGGNSVWITNNAINETCNDCSGSGDGVGGGLYVLGTGDITNLVLNDNRTLTGEGGGADVDGTLRVTNGLIAHNHASFSGGGFAVFGTLYLTNATVDNNVMATADPGEANGGGGIWVWSQDCHDCEVPSAWLQNVVVRNNVSDVRGGGVGVDGAINTPPTAAPTSKKRVAKTTQTNRTSKGLQKLRARGAKPHPANVAPKPPRQPVGGFDVYGFLSARDVLMDNNWANAQGLTYSEGGNLDVEGLADLSKVTLSGSSGTYYGGGAGVSGELNGVNVTISGNSAVGEGGGVTTFAEGITTLDYSTIAANAATRGSGVDNCCDKPDPTTTSLTSSIVANDPATNCYTFDPNGAPINDGGYNIDSGTTCGFTNNAFNNTDPKLGPLASNPPAPAIGFDGFNGNAPQQVVLPTMGLLPGSPAIDTANPNCPPPATDERGVTRPQGPACDRGAFEGVLALTAAETPKLPNTGQLHIGLAPGVLPWALGLMGLLSVTGVGYAARRRYLGARTD